MFLPALFLAAVGAVSSASGAWIRDDAVALALEVVLDDGRSCRSELVLDRARRRLRFESDPARDDCPVPLEVAFDEVGAVRTRSCLAGFEVRLPALSTRLVLVPSSLAPWLARRCATRDVGPCGTLAAPCSEADAPRADSEHAVDRIRSALGRAGGPMAALSEAVQGRPVDADVRELVERPTPFVARLLRVRGTLEPGNGVGEYRLSDEGWAIRLAPATDLAPLLLSARHWSGREVDVVGVLGRREAAGEHSRVAADEAYLKALDCMGPESPPDDETPVVTLQSLATDPLKHEHRLVRVTGKFRGRNAHLDLPGRTQRGVGDWVLKQDRYAVWVTGHAPAGPGFSLDLDAPGPNEWVEVVGRATLLGGVTYLDASRVRLVRPLAEARVQAPRQVVGALQRPVVVFSHPLEGDALAADGRIVVQFSAPMDAESFERRVRLELLGPSDRSVGELTVRLRYIDERRALIVNPTARLEPGGRVRVRLLAGIVDVNGTPLAGRSTAPGSEEVLTYTVVAPGSGTEPH